MLVAEKVADMMYANLSMGNSALYTGVVAAAAVGSDVMSLDTLQSHSEPILRSYDSVAYRYYHVCCIGVSVILLHLANSKMRSIED